MQEILKETVAGFPCFCGSFDSNISAVVITVEGNSGSSQVNQPDIREL